MDDFLPVRQRIHERIRNIAAPLQKFADLHKSSTIDVSEIRLVCLLLGPYRNLTTLTASILALHPNCQVLNHAGFRIIGDSRLDFLRNYTDRKFRNFERFAVQISQSGRQGTYGGSIFFSHAFQESNLLRDLYRRRYGEGRLKEKIHSLFWKESLLLSNHIKAGSNLSRIFAQNPALRFMTPVRNPIDCAFSNLQTGHVSFFPGLDRSSGVAQVITAILDEFAWFLELKKAHPGRFTYFFQHELTGSKLREIANYLGLEDDDEWRNAALSAFVDRRKSGYPRSAELINFYIRQVEQKFAASPDFMQGLLSFA